MLAQRRPERRSHDITHEIHGIGQNTLNLSLDTKVGQESLLRETREGTGESGVENYKGAESDDQNLFALGPVVGVFWVAGEKGEDLWLCIFLLVGGGHCSVSSARTGVVLRERALGRMTGR